MAPPALRGASFGLLQSLDTIGAFLVPLLAIGLMWLTADHFTAVFWTAAITDFLAAGLILFTVPQQAEPLSLVMHARTPQLRAAFVRLSACDRVVLPGGHVFLLVTLDLA